MNSFEDITITWKRIQPARLPDVAGILKKAAAEKTQLAHEILWQVACLCLALATIIWILITLSFRYFTSYAGIAIIFICVLCFALIRYRQNRFLQKLDLLQPPAKILMQLKGFYNRQKWMNSKGVSLYAGTLNIAFALYFYEIVFMAPISTSWKIMITVTYIIWMIVSVALIGKMRTKKEQQQMESIISKLEEAAKAFI